MYDILFQMTNVKGEHRSGVVGGDPDKDDARLLSEAEVGSVGQPEGAVAHEGESTTRTAVLGSAQEHHSVGVGQELGDTVGVLTIAVGVREGLAAVPDAGADRGRGERGLLGAWGGGRGWGVVFWGGRGGHVGWI